MSGFQNQVLRPKSFFELLSLKRKNMYYFKDLKIFILLGLLFGYPMLANISAVAAENDSLQPTQKIVVFDYEVSPMTGVAPDIVQLKGFSGGEDLTFVWESEHECVVGNDTELMFNSPGLSDLVLTVFEGEVEVDENCDTGESKAIKRVGNIVIDLQANMPPAARLEIEPRYLPEPGSFMLDASQSSDSKKSQNGVITNYEFSSSVDGELSSGTNSIYALSLGEGEHVITLVAQDDKNGTSMASVPVNVGDSTRPLAYFTIEANEGMTAPVNIKLNAEGSQDFFGYDSSVDPTINSYRWTITGPNGKLSGLNKEFVIPTKSVSFNESGNYRISLIVTDNDNQTSEAVQNIYLGSGECKVNARVSPSKGQRPHIVTLTHKFIDPDDFPYQSCVWKIEGEEMGCSEINKHKFNESGSFLVELAVKCHKGNDIVDTKTVNVTDPEAPVITSLEMTPTKGFAPLKVHVKGTAYDPNGDDIVSFQWNDQFVSIDVLITEDKGTFTSETDLNHLGEIGEYYVTLTVTDDTGLTDTSLPKTITVVEPPEIIASVTEGDPGLKVRFEVDSYHPEFTYQWIRNGEPVNPVDDPDYPQVVWMTFNEPGEYRVNLTATDTNGTPKKVDQDITIKEHEKCLAIITGLPSEIYVGDIPDSGLRVDGSQSSPTCTNFKWFIDATPVSCSDKSCYFTFDKVGVYEITLVVSGKGKASAPASVTVEVIPPIKAIIKPLPSSIFLSDEPLIVDGSQSKGPNDITYQWFIDKATTPSCSDKTCNLPFEAAGIHKITLKVTGNSGKTNSTSVMVDVFQQPPENGVVIIINATGSIYVKGEKHDPIAKVAKELVTYVAKNFNKRASCKTPKTRVI